mmetsp:Transcript_26726/g.80563  ORF Transcript_26726/g.80563 Transcript_26726/m.80563 type:complete len:260 (-) Transcript_26726:77-856(-)
MPLAVARALDQASPNVRVAARNHALADEVRAIQRCVPRRNCATRLPLEVLHWDINETVYLVVVESRRNECPFVPGAHWCGGSLQGVTGHRFASVNVGSPRCALPPGLVPEPGEHHLLAYTFLRGGYGGRGAHFVEPRAVAGHAEGAPAHADGDHALRDEAAGPGEGADRSGDGSGQVPHDRGASHEAPAHSGGPRAGFYGILRGARRGQGGLLAALAHEPQTRPADRLRDVLLGGAGRPRERARHRAREGALWRPVEHH